MFVSGLPATVMVLVTALTILPSDPYPPLPTSSAAGGTLVGADCSVNPDDPKCHFAIDAEHAAAHQGGAVAAANTPADPNARVCRDVPVKLSPMPNQIVNLADDSYTGVLDSRQEECTQGGKLVSSTLYFYPEPTASSAHALAEKAYRTLDLPKPEVVTSPGQSVPQLTGLPVWLWLRPQSWAEKSSTVSAAGITVRAIATPKRVVWSIGDGSTVTCAGPGTPFPDRPSGDGTAPSPTCGHTFLRTSATEPGGAFHATATIVWRVDWTGFGPGGTFPEVESSAGFPVRVIEAAALVTNSR